MFMNYAGLMGALGGGGHAFCPALNFGRGSWEMGTTTTEEDY